MSDLEPRAAKANAINAQFNEFLRAIRADRELTDEAKQKRIARAYVAADDAVTKLRHEVLSERAKEARKIKERLFRPAPVIGGTTEQLMQTTSYRDARERASTASGEELRTMLEVADLAGDKLQVQAIVATSVQSGDLETVNAYVERHPESEPDLQRYFDLEGPHSLRDEMAVHMAMSSPNKPTELANVGDHAVREMATQNTWETTPITSR